MKSKFWIKRFWCRSNVEVGEQDSSVGFEGNKDS